MRRATTPPAVGGGRVARSFVSRWAISAGFATLALGASGGCQDRTAPPPLAKVWFRGFEVGRDEADPNGGCRLQISTNDLATFWADSFETNQAIGRGKGVGSELVSGGEPHAFSLTGTFAGGAMLAERSRRILGEACRKRVAHLSLERFRSISLVPLTLDPCAGVRVEGAAEVDGILREMRSLPASLSAPTRRSCACSSRGRTGRLRRSRSPSVLGTGRRGRCPLGSARR